MPPTKHRLSRIDKVLLNNACAKHRQQDHSINVLLLSGTYAPIRICATLYLPDMVLGVVRMAWTKFRVALCVEVNGTPLLVIDSRGHENLFVRTQEGPLTSEELHTSFPHLELMDREWQRLTNYLIECPAVVTNPT